MPNPEFFVNPIIQEATIAGNWLGPVPGHINPQQEVSAAVLAVQNTFRLRSDAAADFGNEFDNMIEEWQQEEAEWRKMSPDKKAEVIGDEIEQEETKTEDEDENDIS